MFHPDADFRGTGHLQVAACQLSQAGLSWDFVIGRLLSSVAAAIANFEVTDQSKKQRLTGKATV
ncbi:MAG: hypothetical protein OXF74_06895 [Rhodobacteraceae bacterium]|nr:hypothetical protein [Paracoccaceae bacterium]